ncbi:MAG: SDR family oxidoreductase [Chloroflexi bacterium]|nr:SDR family oxidoreductase [Chloroflexota bacterium]
MEQKRVVITGGAGFIGSNLAKELAKGGYNVIILDDLSTGKKGNIKPILKDERVEFHQGSVTNFSLLRELLRDVDYVFHLAAIPSVPRSIENPQASHDVNMTGTLNVLLAARDNSVGKVIYASSCSVYGDTPVLPKREDMLPNPQSPYAVAKLAGEYYCRVFQQVYGLPTVCLRYFNVYGSGQDANSQYAAVIPLFIKRVSEGKPPIVFGDGEQTRDFTFVKDVVAATILAAEGRFTGIANIGAGVQSSINQLAQLIISLMQSKLKPIYESSRQGDIMHSLADISRARAFGYDPKCSLEEGLGQTVKEFGSETQSG